MPTILIGLILARVNKDAKMTWTRADNRVTLALTYFRHTHSVSVKDF